MKKLLLAAASLLLYLAPAAYAQAPSIQENTSKASLALYLGKQVCKWNPGEGFFGTIYEWGCEFKSEAICTATVVSRRDNEYTALTAGHCIIPAQRRDKNYYVSDTVEDKPVLHHVEVLKSEFDDRYDYALIRFTSRKDYPVVPLNDQDSGAPAVGTDLLNANYSLGLGKQIIHGTVTSDVMAVGELKNRYLTTLQCGPGASGSGVVDAKTGKLVGVVELGFHRIASIGCGVIPTGKNLFNFLEDDSAGLETPAPVGAPPSYAGPKELTWQEHASAIWDSFVNWLEETLHIG